MDVLPYGATVSQGFGCTDYPGEWIAPDCPNGHFHTGVDLACKLGDPVIATRPGTVLAVGIPYLGPFAVALRLDNGSALIYGHLDSNAVEVGQRVEVGKELGEAGTRGNSTGVHLHLAHRLDGQPIEQYPGPYGDPAEFFNALPAPAPQEIPDMTPEQAQQLAEVFQILTIGNDTMGANRYLADTLNAIKADTAGIAAAMGPVLTEITDGGRTDGNTTDNYLGSIKPELDAIKAEVDAIHGQPVAAGTPVDLSAVKEAVARIETALKSA